MTRNHLIFGTIGYEIEEALRSCELSVLSEYDEEVRGRDEEGS
jgi:hypothetical protein